jgi:hypothetical protein
MMEDSNVDSLLRSIASSGVRSQIENSYTDVDGVMKEVGRPTNNVLLSAIHNETKRVADEIAKLNAKFTTLNISIESTFSEMTRLCTLIQTQNEISASNTLNGSSDVSRNKGNATDSWYYQATKLTSKYHVYACIIFHLMDMVQIHMDVAGQHYPDSVDCDFKAMHNAIRVVSSKICNIQGVEYRNTIALREKDSQPFEMLYPLISSSDSKTPTTLSESAISQLCNQVTRGIMQDIEWIRQRLCYLDGVLSIKQIDVLRSICHPIIKPDSDCELNWNRKLIRPRPSHPLVKDIADLPKNQKDEYMRLRMDGRDIIQAYNQAKDYSTSKK